MRELQREFKRELVEKAVTMALENVFGEEITFEWADIRKNNGATRRGIKIFVPGRVIIPVLYAKNDLSEVESLEEVDKLVHELVGEVKNALKQGDMFDDVTEMTKEDVLSRVIFQVVNKEKNKDMLENVEHFDFLDLAVIYRCVIESGADYFGSFAVPKGYKKISSKEFFENAAKNTEEYGKFFSRNMGEILAELMGVPQEEIPEDMSTDLPMVVVGSMENICGASVMLYEHYFSALADRFKSDLIVLPSSIHEVIVVPGDGSIDVNDCIDMVKCVNSEQVAEQEQLSDSVYIYKRKEGKFVVA